RSSRSAAEARPARTHSRRCRASTSRPRRRCATRARTASRRGPCAWSRAPITGRCRAWCSRGATRCADASLAGLPRGLAAPVVRLPDPLLLLGVALLHLVDFVLLAPCERIELGSFLLVELLDRRRLSLFDQRLLLLL